MKKTIAIIMVMLIALTCVVAFAGCNGNDQYDEYFAGAISATTYESIEDAVKGFLEDEISGNAFTAVYVGYTKSKELSESEIDELAIDDEIKANIVSVEKGEVEYAEQSDSEVALAKLSSSTYKRTVYLIKCSEGGKVVFRFYAPVSQVGETLTLSEYYSLFYPEKYMNCTVDISYRRVGDDDFPSFACQFKFSQNTVYSCDPDYTEEGYCFYQEGWAHLRTDAYTVNRYTDSNQWSVYYEKYVELNALDVVFALIHSFVDDNYSCLEKTATGVRAIKERIMNAMEIDSDDSNYEFEIKTSKGKITSAYGYMSMTYYGQYYEYEIAVKIFDFGTTVIEIPQEVKDALAEYIASNKHNS